MIQVNISEKGYTIFYDLVDIEPTVCQVNYHYLDHDWVALTSRTILTVSGQEILIPRDNVSATSQMYVHCI